MSSTLLVSAVFASLVAGVLIAYGICLGMFRVFRVHSMQAAQQRIASREAQSLSAAQMAGN
ncbi:hypothetical protein [Terriglobus saanensis]|uniref:Uncharacterized protein n=1 Tax=Terriglobus saanensis (strain ATCC BAA-1853 / DSM 23119 / SP1PR4) TaxID=401053 RepID=E8V4V2_TERSS|nr:hypothetical protein [Terriglobus saanensis]ADV82580.1 hypothetical protein AciPR4_1774 [Terriglobus saanensis SP1PR4]